MAFLSYNIMNDLSAYISQPEGPALEGVSELFMIKA